MKFSSYYITGATGFLGRAVINELLGSDADIHAFVLEGDPLTADLPKKVHTSFGNVCDLPSVRRFLGRADEDSCVIHCAGIVSVASRPGRILYDVNVEGTKNIIRACMARRIGKLVYVSSVHAIAEKPKGLEMEADPDVFIPEKVRGDYAKSKAIATRAILKASQRGLNVSVVLPSGIIGPGDTGEGSVTNMLMSFLSGKLPIAVRGGYDFVDVRDVAVGIISCAEKGKKGKCYILSGHYATIRDILETVSCNTGIKRAVSYIPITLAKIVAPFYELDSIRRKRKLFFTPYAVAVLHSNALFSRKAAVQDLGYMPRSLAETLADTVAWPKRKSITVSR